MADIGNAVLNIIVKIKDAQAVQSLASLFTGLASAVSTAGTAVNNIDATLKTSAANAKTLAQNVTLLNAALNGTAAAAAGAAKRSKNYVSALQRGIDIARLGEAANRKYAKSVRELQLAWAKGAISGREFNRGSMNLEKERRGEVFSQALSRSRLSSDPTSDHFTKQAEALSKKVVSGAMSAEQAIAKYNREVRKMAAQGIFETQAKKLKTLKIMTDTLTAAQLKYNAAQNAKAAARGVAIADPRAAAAATLAKKIADVNAAVAAGSVTQKQGRQAISGLESEFNKTFSTMGKFQTRLGSMATKMRSFSISSRDAGRQLMMFGGVALAAMTPAIVANAKFEQSVQNVAAVLDGVGNKTVLIERLSAQFLDLGERSEFTATQVAGAARALAKAGFEAREIQDSLEGIVNLASAAGISLEDAAEVAANLTRAFQLSAESIGDVGDKLVIMANKSTADVADLAASFKYASPIASAFGQSIDDIGAALMLLANTGSKGSRAGTGLSRFFTELVEPRKVAKIKELLESVGESADSMIPDEVSLESMITLLDRLVDTKKIEPADLSKIFDQRSTRAILALISQGTEEFKKAKDSIQDSTGAAAATKEARLDTLMGDWLKFTSALSTTLITAGQSTNNFIRDILQYATHWMRQLTEAFENSDGTFLKTIAYIGTLAASLGAMLSTVGSLIAVFGSMAMAVSLLGGPVTALIVALGILAAIWANQFVSGHFAAAAQMREAIKGLDDKFKDTTETLRLANSELSKMREKLELLRRLPTLNPLQVSELFKGGANPYDTSKLTDSRKELVGEAKKVAAEIDKLSTEQANKLERWGNRSMFWGNPFAIWSQQPETAVLDGQIDNLNKRFEALRKTIKDIDLTKFNVKSSLDIAAMDYSTALSEMDKVTDLESTTSGEVDILKARAVSDPEAKAELETKEKLLEIYKAQKGQLQDILNTDVRVIAAQNQMAQAAIRLQDLQTSNAPVEQIKAQEAALFEYAGKLRDARAEIIANEKAVLAMAEAEKALEASAKKRSQANMTESDIKLDEMTQAGILELEQASTVLVGSRAKMLSATSALEKAKVKLASLTTDATAQQLLDANETVRNAEKRLKDAETSVANAAKTVKDLPPILEKEWQDFATLSQEERESKLADMTNKAALAVAQKTSNMAEELRLTKLLAEAELERAKADMLKEGYTEAELVDFEKSENAKIASEQAEITAKYTTDYLEQIDQVNLQLAKKNQNLAEELRLTEKIRRTEIAKEAAKIGDPGIRKQYEDAQNAQLDSDMDEIRRQGATSKSPIQSQLSKLDSRADDLLKKRVENHDKIRDALAQQVRTLQDAQMLNMYLLRLERSREAAKESARRKALTDARRLQNMAANGATEWALAKQFSKTASSLDTAKARGVSSLALSPATNVLGALPVNMPRVPNKPQPSASSTNINSNNPTVNIAAGAITVNGVTDPETVGEMIVDYVKDMFSPKPRTKKKKTK